MVERKLVYGIGVNDADYNVYKTIEGKRVCCPYYRTWKDMLQRCFDKKFLKRNPTYKGCKVCHEWLYFSNFREWMIQQDWEGKQLDKDLLGNGKLYSPETCCFIEHWLNSLFTDCGARRGKYPQGVYWNKQKNKFVAQLNIDGKNTHLGYFDTEQEAHQAYLKAKFDYVTDKMQDYPNQRIKEAVLSKLLLLTGLSPATL